MVRQLAGVAANEIGLGVDDKSHGRHAVPALASGSANPVHAVHHPTVAVENDRIAQISFVDQTHVFQQRPAGWRITFMPVPVCFVQFGDVRKPDSLDREVSG